MPLKKVSGNDTVPTNTKKLIAEKQKGKYDATAPGGANTDVPCLPKKKYEEGDYVVLPDVPIFDEHDGAEEGEDIQFTPETLQRIIDACNARISDTGDHPVITDGHTSDDPTATPPTVVGYADDFKMGDIGKTNPRKAILATLKIRKDKYDRVKDLPRRSIELWTDMVADPIVLEKDTKRKPIDGIALLGAERPARDLGMLAARKAGVPHRYRYEMSFVKSKEQMDPQELIKQCLDALQNTPEFAYIRELIKSKQEMAEPEKYGVEEDNAQDDKNKAEDEEKPEKLKLQRDQERRRYAKLQQSHDALASKVAELERSNRASTRKADLLGLEGEGVAFDMAEELELVSEMEPARYAKHLEQMRKRYTRAPIGVKLNVRAVPVEGGTGVPSSPDQVADAAIKRAHEIYNKSRGGK